MTPLNARKPFSHEFSMKIRSILDKENTFQYTIPSLFGLAVGIMLKVVNT